MTFQHRVSAVVALTEKPSKRLFIATLRLFVRGKYTSSELVRHQDQKLHRVKNHKSEEFYRIDRFERMVAYLTSNHRSRFQSTELKYLEHSKQNKQN